LPYKNYPKGNH
jgi:sodium/potassium-transporting ATPase subunit alpha